MRRARFTKFHSKSDTKFPKTAALTALSVFFSALTFIGMSPQAASAVAITNVNLGTASNFSILTGAAATIPSSTIGGEVGAVAAITVNPSTVLQSTVHLVNDAATQVALSDATSAYNTLNALATTGTLTGSDLAGQIIAPGVYRVAAYAMTTAVTFDAQNDSNAVFIMQSNGALNTTAGTIMHLINGAMPNQIFWVTVGAATLGASSTFYGTMLSGSAAITIGAGTTVCGRAISLSFAVTLDANTFCALPAISAPSTISGTIPALTVGASASTTISANGSPAPTFSVSTGSLPSGLSLNTTTGVISGTPTTAGAYSFTITATNSAGSTSEPYSGTVDAAAVAPTVISGTIPSLTVGSNASTTISANGSPAPTFAVTTGSLPAGLSLNTTTGVISGTPTTAGAYSFTITATNSAGSTSQPYSGTVDAAAVSPGTPTAISGAIPALTVGVRAFTTLTGNGTPAQTYTVTAGALPAGLRLRGLTGVIVGRPTIAGAYSFTVTVVNSLGSASQAYSGTVAPAVAPTAISGTIPALTAGRCLTTTLTGNGTASQTYVVTAGALPSGLVLRRLTGVIYGRVTAAGPYSFTLTVTNSAGSFSQTYSGTVAPA